MPGPYGGKRGGKGEDEEGREGEREREPGGVRKKVGDRWGNREIKEQGRLGGSVHEASSSWFLLGGGVIPGSLVGRSPQRVSHPAGHCLPFCLSLSRCPSPRLRPPAHALSQTNHSLKKRNRKQRAEVKTSWQVPEVARDCQR